MIKDVCIAAANMLGLTEDAQQLASEACEQETADKYLRLYGLVVSEIAEEYRRGENADISAESMNDEEASFTGISRRILAYGVAAEYAITEGLDVAELWDTRYKSSIAMAERQPVRIKSRRFV